MADTVESRAVKIAAKIMQAAGLCRYDSISKCRRTHAVNSICSNNEKLYRCLQAHTSQEAWKPESTPSLWKEIGNPNTEYPEWSQPIGALDAYALGDKVSYNGKRWTSTCDNNVWAPGVYGWEETIYNKGGEN